MASLPKILFSLVARGQVVLTEHSEISGNANIIAIRILEKLSQEDTRVSYSQNRHVFHILVSGGITYLAVAEEAAGCRIPFAFLEDIKTRFTNQYGPSARQAVAYEYNTEFSSVLAERMRYFSNDPNADIINKMKGDIAEVKNVMIENIEKVLERGERLDLLVDKAEGLHHGAQIFRGSARRLRQHMW
eukprot:CAMPEP_0175048192 /NCGR_PEP_ID=MMETSP0052_2-20121109/6037_1 /TAXON_ID=51329 ORGANISM="Polytomella parva, Strain SAG 63-3" /NCGR_SAMPLE_ID=MMETSP0052_2 /ASSEMBLY_ACC=CAM_ASM_000194 /LENGTH=187 /DNA_ID=CAMNT_0016312197 /DNA_START=95 /DNA_END=655 /DNA_ORIENTATION=+